VREEEGSGTLGALGLPTAAAAEEAGAGEEVGASVLEDEAEEGWVTEVRLDAICQLGSPTGDAAADVDDDDDEGME
jgi:hypothetical protein